MGHGEVVVNNADDRGHIGPQLSTRLPSPTFERRHNLGFVP
jgi:hypothetical protein